MEWFKKTRLIWFLIFIIIVSAVLIYFIPNEKFGKILQIIFQTFLSVGVLVLLFQIPFLQNDIIKFIKELITQEDIIKHIDNKTLQILIKSSLKKLANDKLTEFVEECLNYLSQSYKYYYKCNIHEITIHNLQKEQKLLKTVVKNYEIEIIQDCDLNDVIKQNLNYSVKFENIDDESIIKTLEILIERNNKELAKFTLQDHIVNITTESLSNDIKYKKRVIYQFENILSVSKIKKLKKNDIIKVTIEEERKTNYSSDIIFYRLRDLSKGLHMIIKSNGVNIKANMYGNNVILKNKFTMRESNKDITIKYDKWLLPGSGYIIAIKS